MSRRRLTLTAAFALALTPLVVYGPPLTAYYAGILADGDMHNDWLTHLPGIIRSLTHVTGHALAWLTQP